MSQYLLLVMRVSIFCSEGPSSNPARVWISIYRYMTLLSPLAWGMEVGLWKSYRCAAIAFAFQSPVCGWERDCLLFIMCKLACSMRHSCVNAVACPVHLPIVTDLETESVGSWKSCNFFIENMYGHLTLLAAQDVLYVTMKRSRLKFGFWNIWHLVCLWTYFHGSRKYFRHLVKKKKEKEKKKDSKLRSLAQKLSSL